MRTLRVAIIGGGVAGLVSAVELARRGLDVHLLERAQTPGGKMRELIVDGARIDAGPTVFTMRWVFDEVFAAAGTALEEHVALRQVETLARHAWPIGARLDLFADLERSADAIGVFAGAAEARAFLAFSRDSRAVFDALDRSFMRAERPHVGGLVGALGWRGLRDLGRANPFATLWSALGGYFRDPRLLQLFGRYATYCGSSPFLAPAVLMLVAHAERAGVWLVEGGMHRLARALADLAAAKGATLRYGCEVREIIVENGRTAAVALADGERVGCDAVIANADVARPRARAVRRDRGEGRRSGPSGVAIALGGDLGDEDAHARLSDAAPQRLLLGGLRGGVRGDLRPGAAPGAADGLCLRPDRAEEPEDGATDQGERLLCLVNAPARGDIAPFSPAEIDRCEAAAFSLLARCGLDVERRAETTARTTPDQFEALFPATGGALYGVASHGWRAAFQRPGARTRLAGLYMAGGSVHPGAGIPMAAISGRIAAASLIADCA